MGLSTRALRTLPYMIVIGAALYFFLLAGEFELAGQSNRIGPEVWPRMVLLLMIGAAIVGAIQAFCFVPARRDDSGLMASIPASSGRPVPRSESRQQIRRALAGIAVMVAFVAFIGQIGFLLACFAALVGITVIGGFRRLGIVLLVSALGTLGFFIVFQKIAYLSLPLGIGPFGAFSQYMLALFGVR